MQILLDEDVHVKVLQWLNQQGHSAVRTPSGLKNGEVLALARSQSRVLITRDRDFANRLLYPPKEHGGIIVLRVHPPTLDRLIKVLQNIFAHIPPADIPGKLIVAEEDSHQVF